MELKTGKLAAWVNALKEICKPEAVHICDGTQAENEALWKILEAKGTAIRLAQKNSWYVRSDPDDVARVEGATFICSAKEEDAGPTNNWADPLLMQQKLQKLFTGCMQGRTLYVIPYAMGPEGNSLTKYGIEITDSPYVVVSLRIMTRMGKEVLDLIEGGEDFSFGVHSVGKPLKPGEKDVPWPCNEEKYITHFPEHREIWSFGSGYGGNALLAKKGLALRIASVIARKEGWMAEHMMIMGLENPQGVKKYFAGAFPSASGKTNLAMMSPALPGWKVTCVGDDIAWMQFGADGRLYAINPERGFFGVAPGTSPKTNPNALAMIATDTIFTNVALTKEKGVWWEGLTKEPPKDLIDWKGNRYDGSGPAAHPNARFTVSIDHLSILDPGASNPRGVPIDGIIFGGRRSSLIPLVTEAMSWSHGVFMGASQSSERTAAAKGEVGSLRHDPFAMLPFCGYHMGDYFQHWLDLEKPDRKMPKIFSVNWFRKDADGNFLWPGFGDNARVLKWMFERTEEDSNGIETPIGILPKQLDLTGLNLNPNTLAQLLSIDKQGFLQDLTELERYFTLFGDKFPKRLTLELLAQKARLMQ